MDPSMSEPANQVANTENPQTELDENPTAATVEWKATDARHAKVSVMPNDSLAPSDNNRSSSQCLLRQCKDLHLVSSSDSECKMSTAAVLALDPQHGSCIPDKIDVGIVAPPNSPMCSEASPQTELYSYFLIESLNKRGPTLRPRNEKGMVRTSLVDCQQGKQHEISANLDQKDCTSLHVVTAASTKGMHAEPSLSQSCFKDTKMSFAMQVHQMITEVEAEDPTIMRWEHNHGGFSVDPGHPKMPSIMGRYFSHRNFKSFHRRLNHNGWSKVSGQGKCGAIFLHPDFCPNLSNADEFDGIKPAQRARLRASKKNKKRSTRTTKPPPLSSLSNTEFHGNATKHHPNDVMGSKDREATVVPRATVLESFGSDLNLELKPSDHHSFSWPWSLHSPCAQAPWKTTTGSKISMIHPYGHGPGMDATLLPDVFRPALPHCETNCPALGYSQLSLAGSGGSSPRLNFGDFSDHFVESPLKLLSIKSDPPQSVSPMKYDVDFPSEMIADMVKAYWEPSPPVFRKDSLEGFCATPEARFTTELPTRNAVAYRTPICHEQVVPHDDVFGWHVMEENNAAQEILLQQATADFSPLVSNLHRLGEGSPF